jgi:hypothetical protein
MLIKGGLDIHSIIGAIPRPHKGWTLPNHKYTGPYNPLHEQLDEHDNPVPGQEPFNQIDEISRLHDICYRDYPTKKHACDNQMIKRLDNLKPSNLRESLDKQFVKGVIGTKLKLGIGLFYH